MSGRGGKLYKSNNGSLEVFTQSFMNFRTLGFFFFYYFDTMPWRFIIGNLMTRRISIIKNNFQHLYSGKIQFLSCFNYNNVSTFYFSRLRILSKISVTSQLGLIFCSMRKEVFYKNYSLYHLPLNLELFIDGFAGDGDIFRVEHNEICLLSNLKQIINTYQNPIVKYN